MDLSFLHAGIEERLLPAENKLQTLRNLDLFVLDNSIRESTVGQVRGHSLENKWGILEEVLKCGFKDIVVAVFGEAPRVDDVFVAQLCEKYANDLTPFYAFSGIEKRAPSPGIHDEDLPIGLAKIKHFGLRNVIFQIAPAGEDYNPGHTHELLRKRIKYTKENIASDSKIFVNLSDFPFAMEKNPKNVFDAVHFLATNHDIRPCGIMFEEPSGNFSLDALATWTWAIRKLMNDLEWNDGHLLGHFHEKWGFADAAQLECLAAGANGMWASVTNEGVALGHASSTVSIMNLIRMGNQKVQQRYKCTYLRKAAQAVTQYTTGLPPPPKQIVFGRRALDKLFAFSGIVGGEVRENEFDMAEFFGVEPPRRISTLASAGMVQEKLVNFFGENPAFTLKMCEKMKRMIVDDLINNRKDEYMTPMGLALLFGRSGGKLTEEMSLVVEKFEMRSSVHKHLLSEVRGEWNEWDCRAEHKRDDTLGFRAFYNAFMTPYFADYQCTSTSKALKAIDMDKDGRIDWREFELYLKWALAQNPDIPTPDDLLTYAFTQGIIPDMQDTKTNKKLQNA